MSAPVLEGQAGFALRAMRPLYELRAHYLFCPRAQNACGGAAAQNVQNACEPCIMVPIEDSLRLSRLLAVGYTGTALAERLLDDIVSRAGEDMAAGEPSVRLRFGHDGCIMALLTLMRIDGWTTPVTDPAKIKDVWQVHRIPMAANMQFVFYRNKKNPDDVLVRVLLNEKELRLPLPGDRAPYYRWEDFRDFYAGLVREARLKLEATK